MYLIEPIIKARINKKIKNKKVSVIKTITAFTLYNVWDIKRTLHSVHKDAADECRRQL